MRNTEALRQSSRRQQVAETHDRIEPEFTGYPSDRLQAPTATDEHHTQRRHRAHGFPDAQEKCVEFVGKAEISGVEQHELVLEIPLRAQPVARSRYRARRPGGPIGNFNDALCTDSLRLQALVHHRPQRNDTLCSSVRPAEGATQELA